ncbi:MAG: HlyD family efflux transporter periplasmic adaptor subunit [Syntrophomonadaceae bacterium]|nr:HlyD family efflux transporter periplasmic adaptor subunit [Syntrophomonadaceae bacterium]
MKQRQLDLAEKEMLLAQSRILAPADGELLDLYVSPGELVAFGAQVALVANGAGLKVKIEPDQRYAVLAAAGNRAQVWLTNAADTKWEARVAYTEPLANAEQGSFVAELEFIGATPPLYPGQLLSVQLFGAVQPDAIIIPETYVAVQEDESGVWLIRDNRARFTPVQLGASTADGVVVAGGLQAGDVIGSPEGRREDQRVVLHEGNF